MRLVFALGLVVLPVREPNSHIAVKYVENHDGDEVNDSRGDRCNRVGCIRKKKKYEQEERRIKKKKKDVGGKKNRRNE